MIITSHSKQALLASVLFDRASIIHEEAILFEDNIQTKLKMPNTIFKQKEITDDGPLYVLEQAGNTVASGGYVWNYNFPFIDMYYEAEEN